MDMKGIAKWICDAVIPDYDAHKWQREQARVEVLKAEQEITEKKRKLEMMQ